MGDLARLIAAVETGRDDSEKWRPALGDHGYTAMTAFHGSLDAAKALHDALLPAPLYQWHISVEANFHGYVCSIFGCKQDRYVAATTCEFNPARAWLLAVLRALEAEGKA